MLRKAPEEGSLNAVEENRKRDVSLSTDDHMHKNVQTYMYLK